jgi:gluconolactonase
MTLQSVTIPGAVATMRVLATGIGFTEGPVWTGEKVIVTSITRGRLYEIDMEGAGSRPIADVGGGPNGLALDSTTGTIWIAQNGRVHMPPRASVEPRTPGIQRFAAGILSQPLEVSTGAPNDCAIGPDGRLWFTEPNGDPHGPDQQTGHVWAWDPRTGVREKMLATDGYPNGLAFGVGGDTLWVAETRRAAVRQFEMRPGGLHESRSLRLDRGYPDGLALSESGEVFVAGTSSGTVEIFDSNGEFRERIDFGPDSMPTNLCFAGPDLSELVVTLAKGGRVVAVDVGRRGLPLGFGVDDEERADR